MISDSFRSGSSLTSARAALKLFASARSGASLSRFVTVGRNPKARYGWSAAI